MAHISTTLSPKAYECLVRLAEEKGVTLKRPWRIFWNSS